MSARVSDAVHKKFLDVLDGRPVGPVLTEFAQMSVSRGRPLSDEFPPGFIRSIEGPHYVRVPLEEYLSASRLVAVYVSDLDEFVGVNGTFLRDRFKDGGCATRLFVPMDRHQDGTMGIGSSARAGLEYLLSGQRHPEHDFKVKGVHLVSRFFCVLTDEMVLAPPIFFGATAAVAHMYAPQSVEYQHMAKAIDDLWRSGWDDTHLRDVYGDRWP